MAVTSAMGERMRPFFPFYGSKWNTARYYPAPERGPITDVIEPFAASAGYSLFYGVSVARLYDADPIIAGVWSFLLGTTPTEVLALPELLEVGDSVDNYPALPQEARWLIGFWLNRGSASPKKSRTAYSARTDKGQLNWGRKAKDRIAAQLPGIEGWTMTLAPYHRAVQERATWFVDPPYGEAGKHYRVKFSAFESLGEWCKQREGLVIVCENAGATWLPFEPLGSFKSSRGRTAEAMWCCDSARAKPGKESER